VTFVDVLGDAPLPRFKDEVFDTVLCTEVLEHLSTSSKATRAMARVLKPGGHLILSVPFLHWIHEGSFDYFRYTEFGLRHLLDESGLEVVTMANRGGAATVLVDVYARTMNLYTRRILGALRIPHIVTKMIDYSLLSLPQRLAARSSFLVHRRMPGITSHLDTSRQMTLGYVVVARKRAGASHDSRGVLASESTFIDQGPRSN
jgi:SAM-dependent methyltransferase